MLYTDVNKAMNGDWILIVWIKAFISVTKYRWLMAPGVWVLFFFFLKLLQFIKKQQSMNHHTDMTIRKTQIWWCWDELKT